MREERMKEYRALPEGLLRHQQDKIEETKAKLQKAMGELKERGGRFSVKLPVFRLIHPPLFRIIHPPVPRPA